MTIALDQRALRALVWWARGVEPQGQQPGEAAAHDAATSGDASVGSEGAVAPEEQPSTEESPPADAAYTVHRRPHRRRYQTAVDMVLSLGAVGLAVAVILAITWRPKPDPVKVVDPSAAITDVQVLADWPVANPSSALPDDWRLTVARRDFTAGSEPVLALGWITPSGHWIGMQQSGSQGRDAIKWRSSFLPAEWRSAVPYNAKPWRKFANLRACASPCAVTDAPLAYAERAAGGNSGQRARATYIVYGEAPPAEVDAVMRALDLILASSVPSASGAA